MTYLIDYENVHNKGIEKINSFKENDKVVIFYHIDNSTFEISLSKFSDMIKKKVEFQLEEFEQENISSKDKPNYLDFQLATYLGYSISQNEKEEYTIVSNDKDYKAVIDFWKKRNVDIKLLKINISNKQQIAKNVKDEYGKKIFHCFNQLTDKNAFKKAIKKAINLDEVYQKLEKSFIEYHTKSPIETELTAQTESTEKISEQTHQP
ncbi:MAG: hypothetical protein LBL93_03360 [Ruminococcus sp.]|jgi:hypothetical protein|nr:hypothetical protein [Ruminococcus sp.]